MKFRTLAPLGPSGKIAFLTGLVLLLGLSLAACSTASLAGRPAATSSVSEGGYVRLQPTELNAMLQSDEFIFVNVHVPYEGHIPGTDLHIPYDQAAVQFPEVVPDRQTKVIIYCRSGSMSTIAAQALTAAGYENVYELEGGFRAWVAEGFEFRK